MPDSTRHGCVTTEQSVRARLAFDARTDQVPSARAFVGNVLGPWHPCAETAILLTSELVTNSVRHSGCRHLGQAITVAATVTGDEVRIEVTDWAGPTVPAVRANGGMTEGGRGLLLVEALAADWGYWRDGGRTTTWFLCVPLTSVPPRGYPMSSITMTATVPGSLASKTCGTSAGYRR